MTITRRHLLATTAMAGAASAIPLTVRAQSAATPASGAPATSQAPAFHRMTVGDFTVTTINDGSLSLGPAVLPEVSQEAFDEAMEAAFLPAGSYTASLNTYVVTDGQRTILIDAGGAPAMGPTVAKMPQNLAAAGFDPETIDVVLITHMHPDHIGGLLDGDGNPFFANAELVIAANEVAFWTSSETRDMLPDGAKGMVDAAIAVQEAYGGRLRTFDGDLGVDGIEAVPLPGHTPGHTGYRIASGDDSLLVWGDIVHIAPLQFPDPNVFIAFDAAPEEAVATRKAILQKVADERTMIAGMHLPFPGFGHVKTDGDGYAFVPAPWQYL
ncbi:MBL fold metallo-hydrolase [Acuticoccus sp. M5D2P5]|uniref:MBL fold metallo-hydrolase n=1 Tax=Acuticoccus kalidii TaxID=2910977 RepID=UPI001F460626|nr:MBL fold metallo-hydrolase [Acuticoccus kalidii]MCF3932237.1 MBL fold metallo-hydrolase [Acuticoccus kalidii]